MSVISERGFLVCHFFYLLKKKNIAVVSAHIIVCAVVGFEGIGGPLYCTPPPCPVSQASSMAGRKVAGKRVELRNRYHVNSSLLCVGVGWGGGGFSLILTPLPALTSASACCWAMESS